MDVKTSIIYQSILFDFEKSELKEYKQLVEPGKVIIQESGHQSLVGFVIEYQYRVSIWSSMIVLEFGKHDPNEILEISGTKTILNICLKKIKQNEINELSPEIIENKKTGLIK